MNEDKNFLKKCPAIERSSDEWKVIEYKLHLSIGTTSAVVKNIYDISNTEVSSKFSIFAKGSAVLQSFVQTDRLIDQNTIQKVYQNGFVIGQNGMVFEIGFNKKIDIKNPKEYSFVLCKIAVGKSYCYSEKNYKQRKIPLPEGFNSIYLYNEQQNPQIFLHKYVVFQNAQVYPCYLIDFSIDAHKEQQTLNCQNCLKVPPNPAKCYCVTEQANFCSDCQIQCHANKVSSKHVRLDILQRPKKFGLCPLHMFKLELHCNICNESLCLACKINGDHSANQLATHPLMRLQDAYTDIASKIKQNDPQLQKKKNQLYDDIAKIDIKIKEVNTKATHVEQQIYAHFHKALQQLQAETQKKLSFLISDQLQLKRQYDHINWMQSFLSYSLQMQQPHDFLNSWYKYGKYKKQLLSLTSASIITQVKADMKLEGAIHVVVQTKKKKRTDSSMDINMHSPIPFNQTNRELFTSPQDQMLSVNSRVQQSNMENSQQRDFGTTPIRKTVFRKHYAERAKIVGEPSTMKGGYDNITPFYK